MTALRNYMNSIRTGRLTATGQVVSTHVAQAIAQWVFGRSTHMQPHFDNRMSRRRALALLGAASVMPLVSSHHAEASVGGQTHPLSHEDEAFLDDLEKRGCLFFWEQASPNTGQVLD